MRITRRRKVTTALIAERRLKVAKMLTKRITYRDMARALSAEDPEKAVSKTTIAKDVQAITEEWKQTYIDVIQAQRVIDLAHINEMIYALSEQTRHGSVKAIHETVNLLERRAKLLGLDASEKIDISGNITGYENLTDEELDRELKHLERVNDQPNISQGEAETNAPEAGKEAESCTE